MVGVIFDNEFECDSMIRDWIIENTVKEVDKTGETSGSYDLPEDIVDDWEIPVKVYWIWKEFGKYNDHCLIISSIPGDIPGRDDSGYYEYDIEPPKTKE